MFIYFFIACSAWHLAHLYQASVVVLVAYSILYGLTAREARWLGGVTSAAVIILGNVMKALLYFGDMNSILLTYDH